MAVECFVYIREQPLPYIPDTIGTGPAVPVQIVLTEPNTYDFAALGVPPGKDITLTITGGGGGGSGARTSLLGGNGGGGGASLVLHITAASLAAGGNVTLGAGGSNGVGLADPGQPAEGGIVGFTSPSGSITAGGGFGGAGVGTTPAAGGAVTHSGATSGYTVLSSRAGYPGAVSTTTAGAAGGLSGGGGGGAGGAGGVAPAGDGVTGADSVCVIEFAS